MIASLLEKFPDVNASERAALVEFARTTPLVYGPWKQFKALYKLAEAPALSASEKVDVELLGALLSRLDTISFPDNSSALKLAEDVKIPANAKFVNSGECECFVTGRTSYDYSGWRLFIRDLRPAPEAKSGGFLRALGLARSASSSGKALAYDFNARDYIGYQQTFSFKNGALEINAKSYGRGHVYRVDISDPSFPHLENQGPRIPTVQYMKRRARRLLRKISASRPEVFGELLRAMWHESQAADASGVLQATMQWASMDALFARSSRWKQTVSGRGPYELVAPKFHFKTREERAPEFWDSRPDFAREIFIDEAVPVEANAVAWRVLRAGKKEIPTVGLKQLQRFLDSQEPALQSYATRALAASIQDAQSWPGEILAGAILLSNSRARKQFQAILEARLQDGSTPGEWREAFAARLARALDSRSGAQKFSSRRARIALKLLGASFREQLSDADVFAHLALFLEASAGDAEWIYKRIRVRAQKGDLKFLDEIAALPEQFRARVLEVFSESSKNSQPKATDALELVTRANETQNRVGWQFLAATAMQAEEIRKLWKDFLANARHEQAYQSAFSELAAVEMLRRAAWPPADVQKLIDSNVWLWFHLVGFFSFEFFDALLQGLPPETVSRRVFVTLARLKPEVAQKILQSYLPAARDYAPEAFDITNALMQERYDSATTFQDATTAWEFLAASAVSPEVLQSLSRQLWNASAPASTFGDAAAKVLLRAKFSSNQISALLKTKLPIALFSPTFFLTLLELAPGEEKAQLLLSPSDEQWANLRASVLELLARDERLRIAFWSGVWSQLESSPTLLARFDEEFLKTFFQISPPHFQPLLGLAQSAQEPLAMRWLEQADLNSEDNLETLIIAATHPLDGMRLWGLRQVRARGLNVAIALRLMESGLPQSFALGREYFESAPRESSEESDYALALCDSPKTPVQNYGREFIARRASSLLNADTLQKLTEHSDPNMQAWLASQLQIQARAGSTPDTDTRAFDSAVLKTRGKARRAKESVKTRLAGSTPDAPIDAATLVEMARHASARDREWALVQLARRARNGEEIGGVILTEKTTSAGVETPG